MILISAPLLLLLGGEIYLIFILYSFCVRNVKRRSVWHRISKFLQSASHSLSPLLSLALVLSMLVFMKRIWEYMLVCCRLAARTHSFQFHIRYWYQKPNIPIHRYFFPLLISFSQEVSIVMLWRFLYIHNVVRLLKRREFKRKNIYKKNHLSGTIKMIE